MDDRTNTFELIERYLAGELEAEENRAFEQRLQDDPDFAGEVNRQRVTHQTVDLFARMETKNQVRSVFEQHRSRSLRPIIRQLAVAASVLILISLVVGTIIKNQYSNDALLASYTEPYPDRITTMSGDADQALATAMEAYNSGDYETTLAQFENLSPEGPQADLIHLYTGIAQLETGQPEAALATLETVPEDSAYAEAARWYIVLARVALGQDDSARTLLKTIVQEEAYPGPKAWELMRDLESWWR